MITKICSKCNRELDITEFCLIRRDGNKRQGQCNDCKRETAKRSYERNKSRVIAKSRARTDQLNKWFHDLKKSLSCCVCGESDPSCLDFHHINSDEKEFGLSVTRRQRDLKLIEKEINKCACLCSNCHRKLHAGRLNAPLVKLNITLRFER